MSGETLQDRIRVKPSDRRLRDDPSPYTGNDELYQASLAVLRKHLSEQGLTEKLLPPGLVADVGFTISHDSYVKVTIYYTDGGTDESLHIGAMRFGLWWAAEMRRLGR